MELQRVGQDAYVVQLPPVDRYVLEMDAEDARGKLLERGYVIHLLPELMRRIVIETEAGVGDIFEHAPPDRRTGREVLASGPFIGGKEHGAILDGDTDSVVLRIGDQVTPDSQKAGPILLDRAGPVAPYKCADDREVEHFRGTDDTLKVRGRHSPFLLIVAKVDSGNSPGR